jgi:hypothetical protein
MTSTEDDPAIENKDKVEANATQSGRGDSEVADVHGEDFIARKIRGCGGDKVK